jgi:hypothetical protein
MVFLSLIILVLDITAIADCLQSQLKTEMKIFWIALILVLPIVGLVLYYLLAQQRKLS